MGITGYEIGSWSQESYEVRAYIEHEGLASLLGDDPEIQYRMYQGLKDKFPQLNARTKLADAPGRDVELPNPDNVRDMHLYFDFFRSTSGWKARLWRILGELFNKPHWINRGRIPLVYFPSTRTVRLERFGMATRDSIFMTTYNTTIACGYDALTDTLFVLR